MSVMSAPVLLLNASYTPIASVTIKRAIVLVLQEKAEVVSVREGQEIHSENLSFPLPSVVRLVRYINVPHFRKAYLTRRAVLQRDNGICVYCGAKATTMDHVHPRSRGGKHTWENVVAACYPCNQRKDDHTLDEMVERYGSDKWTLPFKPYRPEGAKRIVIVVGSVEDDWEPWLKMA